MQLCWWRILPPWQHSVGNQENLLKLNIFKGTGGTGCLFTRRWTGVLVPLSPSLVLVPPCTPSPSTWSGSSPCPSRSTPPSLAPSNCWAPSTPGCGRFLVRTQGSVLDLRLSTSRRGTKIQQGWLIPFQQNIYFCICKVGASCWPATIQLDDQCLGGGDHCHGRQVNYWPITGPIDW